MFVLCVCGGDFLVSTYVRRRFDDGGLFSFWVCYDGIRGFGDCAIFLRVFFCGPGCWRAVVGSLFCFSMSGLAIVLFGFGQFLYDESLL